MDWVSHPFRYMSSKLNKFLVDFGKNKGSSIINFVPFGNINLALPIPSIRSTGPDIVFTTAFVGFISEK